MTVQSTPPIPQDALDWLKEVFGTCNHSASRMLSRQGNIREVALDNHLVVALSEWGVATQMPSGWVVRVDVRYVGDGRHWRMWDGMRFRMWEVADIGLIVSVVRGRIAVLQKVALLQSKRLYPVEVTESDDDDNVGPIESGPQLAVPGTFQTTQDRVFRFSDESRYQALKVGDAQYRAIREFEKERIPVHYMLYHPLVMPTTVQMPTSGLSGNVPCEVGIRVVPARSLVAFEKKTKDLRAVLRRYVYWPYCAF